MPVVVITGTQWGDEGKGKVVDVLTEKANIVARYQGGHNAGHTVVIKDETYILHMIPSGILHKGTLSIIGNGTVVEPRNLLEEIDGLREKGIEVSGDNLLLSKGAHLIMPYHLALDAGTEKKLGKDKIGTTGRGIGPAYTDKMARRGIKAGDLLFPEIFREKLEKNLAYTNAVLEKVYGIDTFSVDAVYNEFMGYAEMLREHISDTGVVLGRALEGGENILVEGAQGTLLDIDHGTYPYVTSSSASAGGAAIGLGIGPTKISNVLGIVKAYTTRVGEGPFPTELNDDLGAHIQKKGGEFGATTGRPRRCGWLDMVALRYAARVNGLTGIVITKLDILDGIDEINICTEYEVDGGRTADFPNTAAELEQCRPVYESLPGWKESTAGVMRYEDLPEGAKQYLKTIEKMLGVEIQVICTGPRREELMVLKNPF